MQGEFLVDSISELKTGFRFNFMYQAVPNTSMLIAIIGCRVVGGVIYPPASYSKGVWRSSTSWGFDFASGLYDALEADLKTMSVAFMSKHKLNPNKNAALAQVVDPEKINRNFPSQLGF